MKIKSGLDATLTCTLLCIHTGLGMWLIPIGCNLTGFDSILEILPFVEGDLVLLSLAFSCFIPFFPRATLGYCRCLVPFLDHRFIQQAPD